jgi:hypothetical protein
MLSRREEMQERKNEVRMRQTENVKVTMEAVEKGAGY